MLAFVLLIIGVVAFAPMVAPTFRRHSDYEVPSGPQMIDQYTAQLAKNPRNRDLLYMRGHQYAYNRRYKEAIADLSQVIAASNRRVDAYFHRGQCYMAINRYDLALSDFNNALAMDPTDPDLYKLRANTYSHLGNRKLALADMAMAKNSSGMTKHSSRLILANQLNRSS